MGYIRQQFTHVLRLDRQDQHLAAGQHRLIVFLDGGSGLFLEGGAGLDANAANDIRRSPGGTTSSSLRSRPEEPPSSATVTTAVT